MDADVRRSTKTRFQVRQPVFPPRRRGLGRDQPLEVFEVLLLAFLLVRPQGLFGERIIERV